MKGRAAGAFFKLDNFCIILNLFLEGFAGAGVLLGEGDDGGIVGGPSLELRTTSEDARRDLEGELLVLTCEMRSPVAGLVTREGAVCTERVL